MLKLIFTTYTNRWLFCVKVNIDVFSWCVRWRKKIDLKYILTHHMHMLVKLYLINFEYNWFLELLFAIIRVVFGEGNSNRTFNTMKFVTEVLQAYSLLAFFQYFAQDSILIHLSTKITTNTCFRFHVFYILNSLHEWTLNI